MLGYTPQQTLPPRTVHAGRYGQQVGGTHPTGMQSCLNKIHVIMIYYNKLLVLHPDN